ncbi:hypothetical protein [Nocardia rhizosphaerihabitans]|uniref:PPE family domain-containing protein n=1 Tax=Nocardia rhizosphaerihabitans TaxID=1691570 RepID=A0ABQ2KS63_9NOCA|nr:hypothetical protein [Nocardia rhizosphaerihabitans]GGN91705.1 hypothetical protein GCM10011610_52260 [Nocardia rhizosphaerihabitans]
MTYDEYKSKVIAAQEQWNTERAGIYNRQQQGNYSTIFSGDTQPPHITVPDSYDSMTLAQMQAAVAAMKPQLVDDAVTAWANIGMNLMGTFYKFNQEFARTVTGANGRSGWTGAAASAAVAAVNNYAEQSIPLSQAATAISLKLAEMRTGIEETQALMPGLTERANVTGKTLPQDGVMKVDEHNQQEATDEGRRILRTVYSQVAAQTDNGVPYLPTAPSITPGTGDPGTAGGNGGTNTGGTSGQSSGGGSITGEPSTDTPGEGTPTEDTDTQSPTTSQSTDTGSTTQQSPSTTPQSATPTATTPSSTAPGTTTPITPTTPGTGSPATGGRGGGGGTPGAGGRGAGGGTPSTPAPGRSLPGSQTPAAAAAAAARSGAATGGRGAPGMAGMGAPGAGRGGSDDERTKGIPDYLINQGNGELLIGTDGLRTVPPVIGGDHDSAPS